MQNKQKDVGEGPLLKPQVGRRITPSLPLVAPFNIRRHACRNKAMEEMNKAMEFKAVEEVKQEQASKRRFSYADAIGYPLTWLPYFTKLGFPDDVDDQGNPVEGIKLPQQFKPRSPFGYPEPQEKLENWKIRFGPSKKDQCTQTYFIGEPCPICLREEDRRLSRIINLERPPSVVDPAKCNEKTREASIECPDRTYYGSHQLVFFRVGQLVYRGWTYVTPDGRIEHMPRVPRGIPINELRVEKPLRTHAPR